MRIGAVVLAIVSAALLDCATLNPLSEGTCGNGVIDATEDCDGFAPAGVASGKCGAPGDGASACRLQCQSSTDCPEGWGCAVTGICREPSGKFGAIGEGVSAGVETMVVGDFDGDRRKDVLGSGPQGPSGSAKVRVHYFSENATLAQVNALSAPISSPSARDFNKDGVDDFAFGLGFGALGVMSGQLDRSLVPAVFPSARIPRSDARPVIAFQDKRRMPTGHSFDYFLAGNIETKTAGHKNVLSALALDSYEHDLPVGPEGILGDPVWAPFFTADPTSTCGEIAIAMKGATGNGVIQIFSPCAPGLNPANSLWDNNRPPAIINPPLPLDGGIYVFTRVPGVPAELLFGAKKSDGTTVVYLVRSNGTSFGTPIETKLPELPIAFGDLDKDGLVDFILPTGLAVSNTTGTVDAGADAGPPVSENFDGYVVVPTGRRVRWTSARIGQFNGDDLPDFIAASDEQPDIDFFSAYPGGYSSSTISTSGPVSRLAIGDYDGDRLVDIGFVQQRSGGSDEFDVAIAYGRPNGPPETPRLAGRTKKVVFFAPASDPNEPEGAAGGLTLFVEEKASDGGKPDLALAIILANGDRQPIAPLFLGDGFSDAVKQEPNPDVQRDWVPFEVYAGPTRDPNRVDLVAIAVAFRSNRFNGRAIDGPTPAAVWVAEGRGGTAFDAPQAVQEVGFFSVVQREVTFEARTAVGDIDNPKDGANEFVVIQRRPGESSFSLRVARPGPDSGSVAGLIPLPDKSIRRDAPMTITDVDGDGHADVVALVDEGTKRRVVVFYNDGKSGFVSAFAEVALPDGEEAQGFAQLPTRGAAPFGKATVKRDLAVVTTKRVVLATPGADRAVFEVRDIVTEGGAPLGRPTSIARGDFDGDGVDDLAIADSGALRILRQLPVKR